MLISNSTTLIGGQPSLTDLGSFAATYGTALATLGLLIVTAVLAWHSANLVRATNNLAAVQMIPVLTLRHPIRKADSREMLIAGKMPNPWVVEVVNHGNGTAFKVEVLSEGVKARPYAPNRDVIPHGYKRFILPDWNEGANVNARYEDAQGKHYEERLFPLSGSDDQPLSDVLWTDKKADRAFRQP